MDVTAPADPLYRIVEGVHRCVAAREAGLAGIFAAIMDNDGRVIRSERVPLERIYSPKPLIDRWDRGRDFEDLLAIMKSVTGRAGIEPVTLQPISAHIASYLTPLKGVVLTDSQEGES